jgi:hypothetical protein
MAAAALCVSTIGSIGSSSWECIKYAEAGMDALAKIVGGVANSGRVPAT